MSEKQAIKTIEKIMNKNDVIEAGIFISILSYEYMKFYNISQKNFLKSLKNSLEILEKR